MPAGFTGRDEDLGRLLRVLDPTAESDLPVVICAVSGLGGIGKTSLALCAAHKAVRDGWFPGGTVFVDFRGYDDNPVTADQALLALLDGLGVRGSDLPQTSTAQYALYRRLLAEERRPMLLILDNASDPVQLTPLIPGTDHHRVLITSRDRLTDLDARLIDLDVLTSQAATDLVDKSLRLSDERDDRALREPEAVAGLAEVCARHPLALRIAVGMLRKRRHRTITSLVDELRTTEDRTERLGVRPIFEAAYSQLPADQARLLRLLSLAPAAEVSGEVVAALAGLAAGQAFELLEELASQHLVTPSPGDAGVRWRLHDLVRAFAVAVVAADAVFVEEGDAARERVLEFYCRWATAADALLQRPPEVPVEERFPTRGAALAWLDGERAGLVAAVQLAQEEHADVAVRLGRCLDAYFRWRRRFDDWTTVSRATQEAARRMGDGVGEALSWHRLGHALQETGRVTEAIDAHRQALGVFRATKDGDHEAQAWDHLGSALRRAGRLQEAIDAYTQARDLFRAAEDRHREGFAWNNLGLCLRQAGWTREAIAAQTQACDLFRATRDPSREATAWNNLGVTLQLAGRLQEAVDAHTHARDLCQAIEDRISEGTAWLCLGGALQGMGRVEDAIDAYGTALEISREVEDWQEAGMALENLAALHMAADDLVQARAHYLEAADAYTRDNARDLAARAQACADSLT
ncbi:tetratricopeptide repeat protein [Streptomyces spongiae]|uniref:tetratricopeptide repeat protein n=1 Tax=Streptomyces spongiae TaxID=565072 RepID=UPI002AD4D6A0|nr:tetratricopeptide repeat protein [Streptomyces spongiae]